MRSDPRDGECNPVSLMLSQIRARLSAPPVAYARSIFQIIGMPMDADLFTRSPSAKARYEWLGGKVPVILVDDLYVRPDAVRASALELPFTPANTHYPGRTAQLSEENPSCDALLQWARELATATLPSIYPLYTNGRPITRFREVVTDFAIVAERVVRAAAESGVRTMVVRPPAIWGPGDNGQVARVYRTVAATGAACYIGSGLAVYSSVHHDDLARLYSLAIERGTPGALYHAAAGEFSWRWIAESVARDLGVPTRSLTAEEAQDIFGPLGATIYSACSRSLDPRSRRELDWKPIHLDMLSQVGEQRLRALAEPDPADGGSSGHAFPGQQPARSCTA